MMILLTGLILLRKEISKIRVGFYRSSIRSRIGQHNFTSHLDSLTNFWSLTSLRLTCLDITGETVENLLSNCPFLEVLSVDDSNCFKSLKVSGPSLKLRRLELKYLSSDFMDLEIDVGNIISFEFSLMTTLFLL